MDNQTQSQTGPRDVFLQILNAILLYVGIFAFGNLLFQIININFPDPLLTNLYSSSLRYSALRWPISLLVIIFPAFVWLSYYVARDIEKNPTKKDLKSRRWLIHFTIFASAIAILIDLITLVYSFLGGEFTTPFLLKIAVVFFMAISIFSYYLWILKYSLPALKDKKMRYFVGLILIIITASIFYGFWLMGSPFDERTRRLDADRVAALDSIQWQIINHWQNKGVLPASLEILNNPLNYYTLPLDPETGESYEYNILEARKFELCATFKTSNIEESPTTKPLYGTETNWQHASGRVCFEREIDIDNFPVRKDYPIEAPRVF